MLTAGAAREAAGLTVAQAARRAGVTQSYIRQIERHGGARFGIAERLARIYKCSSLCLLNGRETEHRSRPARRRPTQTNAGETGVSPASTPCVLIEPQAKALRG